MRIPEIDPQNVIYNLVWVSILSRAKKRFYTINYNNGADDNRWLLIDKYFIQYVWGIRKVMSRKKYSNNNVCNRWLSTVSDCSEQLVISVPNFCWNDYPVICKFPLICVMSTIIYKCYFLMSYNEQNVISNGNFLL